MTTVTLLPRRARPFFARHPWVFANSIARLDGPAEPGDEVVLRSHEGVFIARGLFNPRSAIRVRLYRWEDAALDEAFWRDRLSAALRLRREILRLDQPGGACRLVFSESDGLSGLTVDRYDRWLVAQFTSLALFERRELFLRLLMEQTGVEGVFLRTERGVASLEGIELEPQTSPALGSWPEAPLTVTEHEIAYQVDPRSGQKTGFYLDQRDNRRAAAAMASGRRVLDLFCYTGGFSLNVIKHGGASHTLGIDSSAPAIEVARQNAIANGLGNARFEAADVGQALQKLRESGDRFGMVICDPPKFARSASHVEDALKAYLRLNLGVLDVLEPDGVLVTCSCSGHVDRVTFAQLLGHVAEQSGRPIQLLEQRGQAADHPVSASCLETDYLKCVIARVG